MKNVIEPNRRRSSAPGGIILIIIAAFGIMAGAFGLRYYRTLPSVQLTNLLKEAQESFEAGDSDTARSLYIEALDMDPSHAETYQGLLAIYSSASDYAAVTNLIRNLPASVPEEAAQNLKLEAVEYIATAATNSMAAEDYESALSLYRSIVAVAGNDIDLAAPARNRVQELETRLYGSASDDSMAPDISVKVVDRIGSSQSTTPAASSAEKTPTLASASAASGTPASASALQSASSQALSLKGTELLGQLETYLKDNAYVAAIQLMSGKNFQSVVEQHLEDAVDGTLSVNAALLRSPAAAAETTAKKDTAERASADPDASISSAQGRSTSADTSPEGSGVSAKTDGSEQEIDPASIWQPIPEEERAAETSTSDESEKAEAVPSAEAKNAEGTVTAESSGDTGKEAVSEGSGDPEGTDNTGESGKTEGPNTSTSSESAQEEGSASENKNAEETSGSSEIAVSEKETAEAADALSEEAAASAESAPAPSGNTEIRLHISSADKTFTVSTYDGTELTVNLPAQKDENGRTVLGIFGKDQYGYGNYVLEGGKTMTAEEYLGLSDSGT